MKTKKQYIAPNLTVVNFKVEHGFTASQEGVRTILTLFSVTPAAGYNNQNIQTWSNDDENAFGDSW